MGKRTFSKHYSKVPPGRWQPRSAYDPIEQRKALAREVMEEKLAHLFDPDPFNAVVPGPRFIVIDEFGSVISLDEFEAIRKILDDNEPPTEYREIM